MFPLSYKSTQIRNYKVWYELYFNPFANDNEENVP